MTCNLLITALLLVMLTILVSLLPIIISVAWKHMTGKYL